MTLREHNRVSYLSELPEDKDCLLQWDAKALSLEDQALCQRK